MNFNRIFCAFPVFLPSKKMFERNMDSVVSFVEYIKANPFYLDGSKGFLLDISYGGWAVNDEYWNTLKDYIKANIPQAKIYRFGKNFGKARVVNELSFDYLMDYPDTKFMFTMDSDMKFMNDQIYFFDRLFLAAKFMQEFHKKPFGFISLDQKDECCHWYSPRQGYSGMDQSAKYEVRGAGGEKFIEEVVWPSDGCGIAGGGLFLNMEIWKTLGGYSEGNHPYHGEDGFYLRDVQNAGAKVSIVKSLSLIHPKPEDDPEYRAWKDAVMKETWEKFDEAKHKESLNKSEALWINK